MSPPVLQCKADGFLRFHTNFRFVIFVQVGDTYPFPSNNINKAHRNAGFCSVFVHFGIPGSNFLLNSIVLRRLNLQIPDIFMIFLCVWMGKFQSMLVSVHGEPLADSGWIQWRRSRLWEKRQRALRRWRVAFYTVSLARSLMVQVRNGEKW